MRNSVTLLSNQADQSVRIPVGTGKRYDVLIEAGLLAGIGPHIAGLLRRPRTTIITDWTVAGHHLKTLEHSLSAAGIEVHSIILEPGEATKSFSALEGLLNQLLELKVERSDMVIAFGGGVIGDLTGFAASILRRGIDFIQIPTTLLAMVDSSVGGKTGINTPAGKNLVGTFWQPAAVFIDPLVLNTLSDREMRAGYAEVLKYGQIDDAAFFNWLMENGTDVLARSPSPLCRAVEVCVRAKARIVASDEREAGVRALLNLGHTFGHAFEAALGFDGRMLHGEAVALGLLMALELNMRLGGTDGIKPDETGAADLARLNAHMQACGFKTRLSDFDGLPSAHTLVELMQQDKKASGGKVAFITGPVGRARIVPEVDMATIEAIVASSLSA